MPSRQPARTGAAGHAAPVLRAGHGGIALIVFATCLFVSMDTLVKHLVRHNPVPQIIWLRFVANMILAAALMLATPRLRPLMRSNALARQLLRSALLMGTTAAFFFGLDHLKLAELVILNQAAPLIVIALSVVLLGEKVGPRRWAGVVVGFIGVLVILRPGFGFQTASLFGLAAALIYALYQIITRALSVADHTMTTFFYTAMVGTVAMAPVALATWQTPSALHLALMAFPGVLGGCGHLLLIMAFARSEASLLAPYFYLAIVLSMGSGWAFFGETPDLLTYAGAGLIAAAGLYVWHRERQIAKRRGQVPA